MNKKLNPNITIGVFFRFNKDKPKQFNMENKNKYLVALPAFPNDKGFNHQTILVRAKDEDDARTVVTHLKPNKNIGDIKKVNY